MPFVVDKISGLFPNGVIRGAHGQMPSGPLEKTVLGFLIKKLMCWFVPQLLNLAWM